MSGKVRKTIKVSTITAEVVYRNPSTNKSTLETLSPITVNGKVNLRNALAIVKVSPQILGAYLAIYITEIIETNAVYEMPVDRFLQGATLAPLTDNPQTETAK